MCSMAGFWQPPNTHQRSPHFLLPSGPTPRGLSADSRCVSGSMESRCRSRSRRRLYQDACRSQARPARSARHLLLAPPCSSENRPEPAGPLVEARKRGRRQAPVEGQGRAQGKARGPERAQVQAQAPEEQRDPGQRRLARRGLLQAGERRRPAPGPEPELLAESPQQASAAWPPVAVPRRCPRPGGHSRFRFRPPPLRRGSRRRVRARLGTSM